jgi:hypothetical protein
VIENNRECLHCDTNHPELLVPLYSSGFGKGLDKDHVAPSEQRFQDTLVEKEREWEGLGLPYELIEFPDNLWFRTVRLPLANQCLSHTLKPEHTCKKLLGNFKKPEGSGLSLWTHPNSWNHFLSDHIITFAVFLVLWIINWTADQSSPTMRAVLNHLSIIDHFDDFARGIIDTKHVVYYLSFITFGLFLTAKSVDSERWRG